MVESSRSMQDAATKLLDSLKQEGTRIGFNANLVEASESALAQVQTNFLTHNSLQSYALTD
jgi:hypothetical protein